MKKIAIVGREEEFCSNILGELRATYPDCDVKAIPLIQTVGKPFVIPHSSRKLMFLFTSPRAVHHFLEQHEIPEGSEVATLGNRTTRTLCSYGIAPNITGKFEYSSIPSLELINHLRYQAATYKLVLPTYGDGEHHYGDAMQESGLDYITLQVYDVLPNPELPEILRDIEAMPEWVLFFSPSSVRSWVSSTNHLPVAFSVDQATTKELCNSGFRLVHESPSPHHFDVLETIIKNKSPFHRI